MQIIRTTAHKKIKTSTFSVCNRKSITVFKPTRWLFCPSLFPPAFKKLLLSDSLSPFQNSNSRSINSSHERFGQVHPGGPWVTHWSHQVPDTAAAGSQGKPLDPQLTQPNPRHYPAETQTRRTWLHRAKQPGNPGLSCRTHSQQSNFDLKIWEFRVVTVRKRKAQKTFWKKCCVCYL